LRPSLLVALTSGVLLIFLVGFVGVEYSSKPSFCGNCHEMRAAYQQWTQSPHNSVSCLKCHADGTLGGYIKVKANGLRQLYVHFTEEVTSDNIEVVVPKERCLVCHTKPKTGEGHIKVTQQMECTDCHKDFVHDLTKT